MNKRKKSRDSTKKKEQPTLQPKEKIIKFNFSYDNLKCFIEHRIPKTNRKRISNKYASKFTDKKNYNVQQHSNQPAEFSQNTKRDESPDPSRQASNQIIEQIQKKGLRCPWNEIQQVKTQFSQEEEWQENQFLNKTFSQRSNSYRKNNSHASTVDRFSGYYTQQLREYPQTQVMINRRSDFSTHAVMSNSEYFSNQKVKYYENNMFEINPLNISKDPRTTLMIKNIPNKYTIQDLSNEIDYNFHNTYDFLYLPCDIKNNCNVGYGFINFLNTDILLEFYRKFHNKKWLKFRSDKICVLTYARLQGLSSLIEHFQNSKVLNHKDKRYQPIIKDIRQCKRIQSLINQQKSEHFSTEM